MVFGVNKEPPRVLIIAGCNVEYTPVISAYISYARDNGFQVDVVQYRNFGRLRFLVDSLKKVYKKKYTKIICANQQSLPVLFFMSWLTSNQLFFWKLESYKLFENLSIALNLQILEYFLNRNAVSLLVPSNLRAKIQAPKFKRTYILPNAPMYPYCKKETITRSFCSDRIKIVIYGSIHNNENIFLNNWVDFCNLSQNCQLTIIGKEGEDSQNVVWRSKMNHDLLIEDLCDQNKYTFSVVGYRSLGQNNKNAAPNKLIESLACGLPVIGHSDNPYIVDLVEKYSCGLLVDFRRLDTFAIDISQEKYSELIQGAINAANELCLSSAILETPLRRN